MEMDRVSFPEAVRKLGAKAGIAIEEQESEADKLRNGLVSVVYNANQQFFNLLLGKDGTGAQGVLKERGFNRNICKDWNIGFAPKSYALSGNTNHHTMSGLTYDNGTLRFTNRIMFGIADESGNLVGFSGRTIDNHPAKYLNSPESSIFHKGKLLYGLDKSKRSIIDGEEMVIVEGQIDAIKCHLAGITNAVAPLGTAFTESQGAIVRRLCKRAVLIFDSDSAGLEAARKTFAILAPLGIDIRMVCLPNGQDPDQFLADGNDLASLIKKAPSYIDALADRIKSYKIKLDGIKELGFAISRFEDRLTREAEIARVAPKVGTTMGELKKQVALCGRTSPRDNQPRPVSESLRLVLSHLLYHGKDKSVGFDWSLVGEPAIEIVMASDYQAGNEASIALVLAKLDAGSESAVSSTDPEEARDLNIEEIYRLMVRSAIRKKADEISYGAATPDELNPLIRVLTNDNT
jgi:DNA primase